jgi:glycosyltransferase involved in cell wall biosynthesis
MKISYAILTHNEGDYVENLLSFLVKNKQQEDEIIVVDDYSTDKLTKEILSKYKNSIILEYNKFENEEQQRTYLTSLCSGDYVFVFDADEIIHEGFIKTIPQLLETNPNVEMFYLPRINTVEGLTPSHVHKWGWKVNEKGWVNFPDYQTRLHKNLPHIKWKGFLHSQIVGFNTYVFLPAEEIFSILHHKKIDRQEKQNNQYDQIEANKRTNYKV